MSLIKVKTSGSSLPTFVSDFFDADLLTRPSLLDFAGSIPSLGISSTVPSVNITEEDKKYEIELAAPGLDKRDFKIETDNDMLTISCEKEDDQKEKDLNYSRQEFSYKNFLRSFELPVNADPEKIEAKYENGILKLSLPKKDMTITTQKKSIKVN